MNTQISQYRFEVAVEVGGVASAVLTDQAKSLDQKLHREKKRRAG
ncbi:MAG: hypothetical protein ABI589_06195 [Burkholderiales bacterium]